MQDIKQIVENLYNTYENTIKVYGDFELPVPTYEINSKVDFRIILALILRSNVNTQTDNYRYIEYSNLNKKEICKECGISRQTFDRKIEYLENIGILSRKQKNNGMIYIINYSKGGKYYITIQHKILKYMLDNIDDDAIKVYLILKIQCDILKNRRPMTNAYICSLLGKSPSSKNNLYKITKGTNILVEHGLINKVQKRIYDKNKDGKTIIIRTDTYYTINTFEVWNKQMSIEL